MMQVGSRKLKNGLGAFLARVRAGETILITDRGRPVARLSPAQESARPEKTLEERLHELAANGQIYLAPQRGDRRPFRPARVKGKPLSKVIIEDRE